jgi:putative transcriptional regulator
MRFDTLAKLCFVLECDPGDLIDYERDPGDMPETTL